MNQPPPGPPPGSGNRQPEGAYPPPGSAFSPPEGLLPPPEGRYPPPDAGYQRPEGAYPPPEGSYPPPDGAYPVDPSFQPVPPPAPPRPPRRGSPVIAPVLAFVALLFVGAGSYLLVDFLSSTLDSATTEASPTPVTVAAADVTEPPAEATDAPEPSGAPDPTDRPLPTEEPEDTLPPEPETTAEPITVRPPSSERADVPGSLLFTRLNGDIWAASGTTMNSLTDSDSTKADSNPTWSPDGQHIYFIRSTKREVDSGKARKKGKYTLYPTDLMRMNADGGNKKRVFKSLISDSRGLWFSNVLQPSVSKAGNNVAVVSDGNDGSANEVVLHVINKSSGRMRKVDTPSEAAFSVSGFGHNDPDFSADGTKIAFTYNDNKGTEGNPRIAIFTCQTKANCIIGKTKYLKFGYANPSWSPNGKLLAVETTDSKGRDIAIITAKGGHERVRLTNNGDSFAPEFSPNGDQIAYLKRDGLAIDARVMSLEVDKNGNITLVSDRPVTSDGEVDGHSGLSWFIPKSELSRSVDQAEEDGAEASDAPDEDAPDGAPPPPPGS